ncbi:MAG TPA: bile acid:sodium symporter family protein [Candidatus Omnitrophota bacterium]|nr:bile acid:sodium symporter family protein [Candidatus Omnitrophota bacterium]HPD85601.1 bile acid:sodium symporter family protein [Candidatus Omnitrophota bacterium]HRZ04529.1 bile acid:sodium symporter family protein [Candidatus Omnitrophota bacterium]
MPILNKLLNSFTKLLVVWVVIAVGVGYFRPQSLTFLKDYTDWLFSLTMFGIGMVLTFKDFEPIFKTPRIVLLGVLAQFAIMPLLAFAIAKLLDLPPDLATGLILAGAVPDAMAAGVVSYLAAADVAFSVALTSLTTFVSPVLTPALTYGLGRAFIPIQFLPMFLSIMKMVIVPLLLGLVIKQYFGKKIEKFIPVFPALSTLFIAFICGLVVALNKDALAEVSLIIFWAVFLLNFFGLVLGYGAGKLFGFDKKRCRTLAIGVGMQNAGLGAVLAIKHLTPAAAIPNAFFATWCIITASILAGIWGRKKNE